jgi:hypothetical protein
VKKASLGEPCSGIGTPNRGSFPKGTSRLGKLISHSALEAAALVILV